MWCDGRDLFRSIVAKMFLQICHGVLTQICCFATQFSFNFGLLIAVKEALLDCIST